MGLKIIKPGWQTLIMDQGRPDARQWGIPQSGVLDIYQYQWANGLVGNAVLSNRCPPVLEIRSGKVLIEFEENHVFALTGSPGRFLLDGEEIHSYIPYKAIKGQSLYIEDLQRNGTLYLAVNGNWKISPVLGSASSDILSPFPDILGRRLQAKDAIPIIPDSRHYNSSVITSTPHYIRHDPKRFEPVFRVTGGPELTLYGEEMKKIISQAAFTIARDSNRMGYRLDADIPAGIHSPEIISSVVVPGMIQWPTGRKPILLLPNCQTTGGYPRVAKVIEADMWKLAYTGPGDHIRFQWSTPDEAHYLLDYQQGQFENAWRDSFTDPVRPCMF